MPTSFEVIFLGTLPVIDTTQGNEDMENAAALIGTYGSSSNPLANSVRSLTPGSFAFDNTIAYDVNNSGGYDTFSINGGAAQNFDGIAVYNAVITYTDGTTAVITANVFQDTAGNTFLAPENTDNTDQVALVAKPIQSLQLTSVVTTAGDMFADRVAGDFISIIDGTAGNDNMAPGYTDAQGDAFGNGRNFVRAGDGNDLVNDGAGSDTVFGGSGNDSVYGISSGDDVFHGEAGDDALGGGDGSDVLFGGAGNDAMTGNSGRDTLDGGDGSDTITAGIDDDYLLGGAGDDSLDGEAGNDVLDGGSGNDTLAGGDGNDLIRGDANLVTNGSFEIGRAADAQFTENATLEGWQSNTPGNLIESWGQGHSGVNASDGRGSIELDRDASRVDAIWQDIQTESGITYTLSLDARNRPSVNDSFEVVVNGTVIATVNPGQAFQNLTYNFTATGATTRIEFRELAAQNSSGGVLLDNVIVRPADTQNIQTPNNDDSIDGGAGNDTIDGGIGNDTLQGSIGDDSIFGRAGNDSILGGDGNDTVFAGLGNDTILGGDGNDSVFGDSGDDTILGGSGNDTLAGFAGNDVVQGEDGNDLLGGWDGDDSLFGGAGSDSLWGEAGNDSLDGGDDNDLIDGREGNDALLGGGGDDRLFAGLGDDTLDDGTGNDTLYGAAGNDLVQLNSGNDTIYLEDGNDTVNAWDNTGQKVLFGGAGTDRVDFQNAQGASGATVTFTGNGAGTFSHFGGATTGTFSEFEAVSGTANNDVLNASATNNGVDLDGEAGNDSLTGGSGADTLAGGIGNDTLAGGDGNDLIRGDVNLITNGSFEIGRAGDGVLTEFASLLGWQSNTPGNLIESWGQGTNGVNATDGRGFIELDRDSTRVDSVWQDIQTQSGVNYTLTLDARNRPTYNDSFEVVVNGNVVATVNPGQTFQTVTYNFTATGATTRIEFRELASQNNAEGVLLDNVVVRLADDQTMPTPNDDDSINAGAGNDTIDGGIGADTILGDAGDDSIFGRAGNDSIFGGFGNDTIFGGIGNDTLDDWNGNDLIYAGAGNDFVHISLGNDTFYLDDGDDTINAWDNTGAKVLFGGAGNDLLDFQNYQSASGATVTFTGNGAGTFSHFGGATTGSFSEFESVSGTVNNDSFNASAVTVGMTLDGEAGDDTLIGGSGADSLIGGTGNDSANGGAGNDTLNGGDGSDTLQGDADNDLLRGDAGNDQLFGGTGNDTLLGGTGNDTLDGGAGTDRAVFTGALSDYSFSLGPSNEVIVTDSVAGRDGTDTLTGIDEVEFNGVTYNLVSGDNGSNTTLQSPGNGTPTLIFAHGGDDSGSGNTASDIAYGGAGNDTLNGGDGNDTLFGEADNDLLRGDAGNDQLIGGTGNDTLQGGTGNDTLDGGTGTDRAVFAGSVTDYSFARGPSGELIVTDSVAGRDGTDTLTNVETVEFGGVTYTLVTGDDGGNTTLQGPNDGTPSLIIAHGGNDWGGGHSTSDAIFGGAGNDTLDGGDGNDTLVGEADNDLLRGDAGNDQLDGGTGNDTLQGGTGNDTLDGGADADLLQGGAGNDTIATGSGEDVVFLTVSGGADRITDFDMTRVNGRTVDQLDVSELTNAAGDPVSFRDVVVTDTVGDGSGDAVLTFPGGESVVLVGVSPAAASGWRNLMDIGIPCFASATPVLTPAGWVPVETVRRGDLVQTTEGPQRVIWAGKRHLTEADLDLRPDWKPVHFPAGAIGNTVPLRLSPQHAVLLHDREGKPTLVRARHLAEIGFGKARVAQGVRSVTYHHILTERHAILCAAGAPTESFYPGRQAMAMLDWPARMAVSAAIVASGHRGGMTTETSLLALYGDRIHPLASRKALAGLRQAQFDLPACRDFAYAAA